MYKPAILGIFGHRGYGKTTLCKKILNFCPVPVLVLDFDMQYREMQTAFNSLDYPDIYDFFRLLLECKKGVFVLSPKSEFDLKAFYLIIPYLKDTVIVIDEMAMVCNQLNFHHKNLREALYFGRHKGIGFIGCSQRIRKISKDFISQCNYMVSFRLLDFNDRNYLQGIFSKEQLAELAILAPYKFITYPKDINLKSLFHF